MTKNTINFDKIKGEIESRRKEKNMVASPLGESVGSGVAPRDVFLHELLKSRNTGNESPSTHLIKMVENKVAAKKGESLKMQINETTAQSQTRKPIPPLTTETVDMSPERDEQLFRDLEIKRKQTLAESIEEYAKTPTIGAPMSNTPVKSGAVSLNEQYLTESVTKIVNTYLVENFGPILEEAIKGTILEMYAVERIKEVLQENKDMVKAVVIEVIREIQAKSKNKAQS